MECQCINVKYEICDICEYKYCDICINDKCNWCKNNQIRCPKCSDIINLYEGKICITCMYFSILEESVSYCRNCDIFFIDNNHHINHHIIIDKNKLFNIAKNKYPKIEYAP